MKKSQLRYCPELYTRMQEWRSTPLWEEAEERARRETDAAGLAAHLYTTLLTLDHIHYELERTLPPAERQTRRKAREARTGRVEGLGFMLDTYLDRQANEKRDYPLGVSGLLSRNNPGLPIEFPDIDPVTLGGEAFTGEAPTQPGWEKSGERSRRKPQRSSPRKGRMG